MPATVGRDLNRHQDRATAAGDARHFSVTSKLDLHLSYGVHNKLVVRQMFHEKVLSFLR